MISKTSTSSLKGIAILLVVVGHLVTNRFLPWPHELRYFASFGVSIFLILSGYGLAASYNKNGLDNFFKKKFIGVYFPFMLSTILLSIFSMKMLISPLNVLTTLAFINFDLTLDGTMWYIYFIAIWYVFFFFSFRATSNNLIRLAILFGLGLMFIYLDPFRNHTNLSFQTKLHALTFPIGVMLFLLREKLIRLRQTLFLTFTISFMISICVLWGKFDYFTFGLCGVLMALSLFFLSSLVEINWNCLVISGFYSYEIYLFEGVMRNIKYSSEPIINAIALIIILFGVSIIFKKFTMYSYNYIGNKLKAFMIIM